MIGRIEDEVVLLQLTRTQCNDFKHFLHRCVDKRLKVQVYEHPVMLAVLAADKGTLKRIEDKVEPSNEPLIYHAPPMPRLSNSPNFGLGKLDYSPTDDHIARFKKVPK